MEPLFFKAENGAGAGSGAGTGVGGFNGAAFFQSGKSHTPSLQLRDYQASMEPLFFKAENISRKGKKNADRSLQWSRFFSKRKILEAR